jgi:uncharacterized protein involved in type VI secretion and phage assembly
MSSTQPYSGEQQKRSSGVSIGVVTNNKDPDNLGRVKLRFPWQNSRDESSWARVAVLMAGNDRGTYFLPEVGDEMLVSFDFGDKNRPYVLGALWNGKDRPPERNVDGENNSRMIKSKSGHKIIFIDKPGEEKVVVHTKSGHQIILDDSLGKEKIEVKDKTGSNSILIDSVQNSLSIRSQTKISIEAQNIEIKAGASLNLQGGIVKIN